MHSPSMLRVFCITLGANIMRRGKGPKMNKKQKDVIGVFFIIRDSLVLKTSDASLDQKS